MVAMDSNMETLTTQNRKTNFSIAAIMSGLQAKETTETKVDIPKDDSSDNLPPLDNLSRRRRRVRSVRHPTVKNLIILVAILTIKSFGTSFASSERR